MRGLFSLLTLILVGAGLAAQGVSGSTGPTLRLVEQAPAAFAGRGFHPSEHVVVTLVSPARHSRTVVATSSGSFRVSFARVSLDPCVPWTVSARGDDGSRVTAAAKPLPECAPPQPVGQ